MSSVKKGKALKKKGTAKRKTSIRAEIRARGIIQSIVENPRLSLGKAMIIHGMSPATAQHPRKNLMSTRTWNELLDEFLPHDEALDTHRALLRASNIDRATFDDPSPEFTDAHIVELFQQNGCSVMRIVRRVKDFSSDMRNSVDVYFWAPDNRARKDGLDMLYKMRGVYVSDKAAAAAALLPLAALNQVRESLKAAQSPHEPDEGL